MRVTLVAVILLATVAQSGCSRRTENEQTYDVGPVFVLPNDAETATVSHTFRFVNPSARETAHLAVKHTSCGCSTCSIESPDVPPGGETSVVLTYEVPPLQAHRREGATVETGLREPAEVEFFLEAEVFPRLSVVSPSGFMRTYAGDQEAVIRGTVMSYEHKTDQSGPIRIFSDDADLTVNILSDSTNVVEGRRSSTILRTAVQFEAKLNAPRASGDHVHSVVVQIERGSARLEKQLSFRRRVPIVVQPGVLFLKPGRYNGDQISLRLSAAHAFSIVGLQCEPAMPHAKLGSSKGPAEEHRILVTLSEYELQGPVVNKVAVVIDTDHPQQTQIRVPLFVMR